jgi:uncharacterized protein with HEPN domain
MPNPRTDAGWLWDMLEASRAIQQFVTLKTFADYESDLLLRSAVERQLEIIGEAARHISTELQVQHPEIPWRQIIAQRHVLAHDYGEVRHDLIWRVATVHIPELIAWVEPLVPPLPGGGSNVPA